VTRRSRHLAVLLAGAAVVVGIGCGSEEKKAGPGVPKETATQLVTELDLVQKRIDATRENGTIGSCGDVDAKSYPDIQRIVEGLPQDTDPDVRSALEQSIAQLKKLTEAECSDLAREIKDQEETVPDQVVPPPVTPPQPTTPEPTETEPAPPEEKKPGKEKEPKDNGNGQNPGGIGVPGEGGGQPAPLPEEE